MKKLIIACAMACAAPQAYSQENCPNGNFSDPKLDDNLFQTLYKKGMKDFEPIRELSIKLPNGETLQMSSWDPIQLPNGRTISVSRYLKDLNDAAKCMALEYGVDLLGNVELPPEFAEYYNSAQDLLELKKNVDDIVNGIKNYDPKKHAEKLTKEFLEKQLQDAIMDENNPSLRALYEDVQALKDLEEGFDPIPVPSVAIRDDLDSKTYKEWRAAFGKKQQLRAEAKATFDLRANKGEAQVIAKADATIEIFGSDPKTIMTATGIVTAPAKGQVTVDSTFWVTGIELEPYKASVDILDVTDSIEHQIVNVNHKFWFSVGPIPVSVTMGASGSAGVGWGLYANGVLASASLGPHVKGDAYMEAAADIVIAKAGAGGRLTLIDATCDLKASAWLDFEPDGTPFVQNTVTGESKLILLAGEAYTFVEIPVPQPPFTQRFEKTLYKYPGIQVPMPGQAVNFSKKGKPGGEFSIEGIAEASDVMAVDFDNKFSAMMTVIDDDLNAALPVVNEQTALSLGILDNLEDRVMDPFLDRLVNWK